MRGAVPLALVGLVGVVAAAAYARRRVVASSSSASALDRAPLELDNLLEEVLVTVERVNPIDSTPAWLEDLNTKGAAYKKPIADAEAINGLPPRLLARMAWQESRFRPDIITGKVRSAAGAVGILQFVPKWHPELGEAGALDPSRAIPYAAAFLRRLYNRFRSWPLAIAAYNAGEGNVAKYGNAVPPFAETQAYVRDVARDVGLA